jgi:hypothetical protein
VQTLKCGSVSQLAEDFGRQCPEEVGLIEHLLTCRHFTRPVSSGRLSERLSAAPW